MMKIQEIHIIEGLSPTMIRNVCLTGLQHLFASKPLLTLNKISFGVYAFHWPVICSIGSYVLLKGIKWQLNPIVSYLTAFVISLIFVILISIVYYHTVEKITTKTIKHLKSFNEKLAD